MSNNEQTQIAFLESYDHSYAPHYMTPKNDVCIITSCCKRKTNFDMDVCAIDRYDGAEINILKRLRKYLNFDLYIISAKFGLIPETAKIPSYEKSFKELTGTQIENICESLQIRPDFERVIEGYKVVILMLGDKYIKTLNPKKKLENQNPIVYFSLDKNVGTKNELQLANGIELRMNTDYLIKKYKHYGSICLKGGILYEYFKQHDQSLFLLNPEIIKEAVQ